MDAHPGTHGVEPICKVLQIAPSGYRRYAAQQRDHTLRPARARRDEELIPQIERVWQANMQFYGANKLWCQLVREGTATPPRSRPFPHHVRLHAILQDRRITHRPPIEDG